MKWSTFSLNENLKYSESTLIIAKMWGCFENPFENDTRLDPRPLPSMYRGRRCSALSAYKGCRHLSIKASFRWHHRKDFGSLRRHHRKWSETSDYFRFVGPRSPMLLRVNQYLIIFSRVFLVWWSCLVLFRRITYGAFLRTKFRTWIHQCFVEFIIVMRNNTNWKIT